MARADGKIVGLAHAMDNGFTAYLCYLLVDPAFQGHGLGEALLAKFDKMFVDYRRLMMTDNSAVGFYRKNGYGQDGCFCCSA